MRRHAKLWSKVLFALFGMGAGLWGLFQTLGASYTHQWEAYAASLRATGQPLTFEEIEARRMSIPDEVNSARVIESLRERLQAEGLKPEVLVFGQKGEADFFRGLNRANVEISREFFQRPKDLLGDLGAIADKPTGHFVIDYTQEPIAIALPDLSRLRNAAKFVQLDSILKLVDGDAGAAVHNTRILCRLAGTLHDEPVMISRLVQLAIEHQAMQNVENILRTTQVDHAALVALSVEMQGLRDRGTMRWAMLGERAYFLATAEQLLGGCAFSHTQSDGASRTTRTINGLPAFLLRSNQLEGARLLTILVDAADDDRALHAAARKMETEVERLSKMQVLVKTMLPSLSNAVTHHIRTKAMLECTIAALAAERFRMAEGRLPETLAELVPKYLPAIPADPFDGKPLRLVGTAEGVVIYSIDDNGVDDGGLVALPPQEKKLKRAPDVGFRLNHTDHRGVRIVDSAPVDNDE